MAMEPLSQQDIDSLLRGAAPAVAEPEFEVQSYNFLRPPRISKERQATLDAIHSRFSLALQSTLSSRLRHPTDVTIAGVEQATFGEYVLSLSEPCATFVFDLGEKAAAQAALDLDVGFANYLLDRLFGGPGDSAPPGRPLTSLEQLVLRNVGERVMTLYQEAWGEHLPITPEYVGYEALPGTIRIANPEDNVLVANLEVKSGGVSALVTLCVPLTAMETFLQEKAGRLVQGQRARADRAGFRTVVEEHLRRATLPVTARLPLLHLAAADVAGIQPGQVILTGRHVDSDADLHVNGSPRFTGRIGQHHGFVGFRVSGTAHQAPRARLSRGRILMSSDPTSPARLDELTDAGVRANGGSIEQLLDMTLPVAIEFGRTTMTVQEILDLAPGSVVQLERMVGEPIDIFVSDRRLAEGEVVVVGEHFGVRITRVLTGQKDAAARPNGR